MGFILEVWSAALCVLGLTGLLWCLLGRLLRPLPCGSAYILLPGRGEGDHLEHTVRAFIWLRSLGMIQSPILIADLGLSLRGRELALRLCARWPGVLLWPVDDLMEYLKSDE